MDDADIGFYIRCLNHAWVNGGIPADATERARALRTRKDTADKRWLRVGKCFRSASELGVNLPNADTILCNPRQEVERKLASQISQVRAESAKQRSKSNANAQHRAYEYIYTSSSESLSLKKKENFSEETAQHFEEFWKRYPRKQGRERAFHAWCFVATQENEPAIFACLASYTQSGDVVGGATMYADRWLNEQNADGWAARWDPPMKAAPQRQLSVTESALRKVQERRLNGTH